jgi:phosphatidate cytidylyltransferase
MFKTRLLSGIVLVIAAIFLIVTGNEVLLFSTLLISCIGMFELFRVFKFEKSLLSVVPYIALILFYINLRWSFIPDVMMLFMGFLIVLMFVYVLINIIIFTGGICCDKEGSLDATVGKGI